MFDWSELWLSEGFTTYFVFDLLNVDHPHLTEHEYYTRLIQLIRKQTSTIAGQDSSPPLIQSPASTRQLERMFSSIHLYTKGAVVVKMIKDLVGSKEFRSGVTRFLRENAYKSVDHRNLWASLPEFADHGVDPLKLANVLDPWLFNEGIPEVIIRFKVV